MTKPKLEQGVDYERGFIDGMQNQMQSSVDKAVNAMSQRKPLTDEQIDHIAKNYALNNPTTPLHFARAIEAAHGIKGD